MAENKKRIVPFRWCYRLRDKIQKDSSVVKEKVYEFPESINGMSFIVLPYERVKSREHLLQALRKSPDSIYYDDGDGKPFDLSLTNLSGYAVVSSKLIEFLRNAHYCSGSDTGSDAVADFKVGCCVGNAQELFFFKEFSDKYIQDVGSFNPKTKKAYEVLT